MIVKRTLGLLAATCATAGLFLTAAVPPADAGSVTAFSRYGNGALRAPVRLGQFGMQVRLPGGTWIYCERTSLFFDRNRPCSETLRRHSLDFWETMSEEAGGR